MWRMTADKSMTLTTREPSKEQGQSGMGTIDL